MIPREKLEEMAQGWLRNRFINTESLVSLLEFVARDAADADAKLCEGPETECAGWNSSWDAARAACAEAIRARGATQAPEDKP